MDATELVFTIDGDAVPQPRARATRAGHMYTPTKNGIRLFKQAIAIRAGLEARRRCWQPALGPHECHVECVFARPPSHLAKSGELRAGAPEFPGHRSGDWDNLAKGVQDAVTDSGAIWHDDSQVVYGGCRKRYAARGEPARTIVIIRRLSIGSPPA
jgi:Holliday junction resolvase RusA-like endonuclease